MTQINFDFGHLSADGVAVLADEPVHVVPTKRFKVGKRIVVRDWFDWMPDGEKNGYMHDKVHPNAKGMNVAAHKIREWVNTLSGPKINGEIPAWSE